MVVRLLFLLALLLPLNANAFAQLTATVDKNPAMLNESMATNIDEVAARSILRTKIDNNKVTVGENVTYTATLHVSSDFTEGSLTEPKMLNATTKLISRPNDKQPLILINGIEYRVLTFVYEITTKKEGSFKISAPVFNAQMLTDFNSKQSDVTQKGQPTNAVGQEHLVTVITKSRDQQTNSPPGEKSW